jgi:hypothetical protein
VVVASAQDKFDRTVRECSARWVISLDLCINMRSLAVLKIADEAIGNVHRRVHEPTLALAKSETRKQQSIAASRKLQ